MGRLGGGVRRWAGRGVAVVLNLVLFGAALSVALFGLALIAVAVLATGGYMSSWLPPVIVEPGLSTADLTALVVAGGTVLLADTTALLAWFTWRSVRATRREAATADAALVAARLQADIAERTLQTVILEAEAAKQRLDATSAQARAAQEQLGAGWRPFLGEPDGLAVPVTVPRDDPSGRDVHVSFRNIGTGPAFLQRGFLGLGTTLISTEEVRPLVVPPREEVRLTFHLSPALGAEDRTIAEAMDKGADLIASAIYRDIGGVRGWRSRGRLVRSDEERWRLVEVRVSDVEPSELT